MPSFPRNLSLVLFIVTALTACQSKHAPAVDDNESTKTFASSDFPLTFDYQASLTRVDGDASGYFDNGSWQVADGAPGERLLMLKLPESNEITTGLWRLGASRDAKAVETCLSLPDNAQAMPDETMIGNRAFQSFTTGDAGMSHFQTIQGYRAVVGDACYAIDLIVEGTNGEVYDPPREAPFSRDEALSRLETLNDGLSFSSQ